MTQDIATRQKEGSNPEAPVASAGYPLGQPGTHDRRR
jgi:hypothetical protein